MDSVVTKTITETYREIPSAPTYVGDGASTSYVPAPGAYKAEHPDAAYAEPTLSAKACAQGFDAYVKSPHSLSDHYAEQNGAALLRTMFEEVLKLPNSDNIERARFVMADYRELWMRGRERVIRG